MQGAIVYYTIPILGGIPITETMVNSWIVMIIIALLCYSLTKNLTKSPPRGRQCVAELLVTKLYAFVGQTMGEDKLIFAPYIATLFAFSLFSSLLSLFTLRAPTADLNTTLGWALITFVLVQVNKFRTRKVGGYFKSFIEPVPVMLPLNILSEIANPLSLAFRHFGNIAAGMVINSLLYSGLAALSTGVVNVINKWLGTAFLSKYPIFQVGIPGVASVYFDLFTSGVQAFIFCMLTMVFISMAMDD